MSPDPADRPLDVFVHIPKTAGSTLSYLLMRHHASRHAPRAWAAAGALPGVALTNPVAMRWLSRRLAQGCPYVGVYARRPDLFDGLLRTADWVGGHVSRPAFERHLRRVRREARLFSVLRDPADQVASHYQWWIEIHDRGPWRYLRYGEKERALSRRIRAADNSDPRQVVAILDEHSGRFMNVQSGYLVHRRDGGPEAALRRLAAFGIGNDLGPVFRAMTGYPPPAIPRVNPSRSRLDRSVFWHPIVDGFLRERNAADLELYRAALDLRGSATGP